jgi:hypothetical protein
MFWCATFSPMQVRNSPHHSQDRPAFCHLDGTSAENWASAATTCEAVFGRIDSL